MRENENAEIVIGMQIHPQPIQSWRTEHFGNAVDDSNLRDTHWGDFADPGSGRINLLSYAMGLSPFERGQESLPQAETLFAADQKYLTLRFRRRLDDPTLQFVPEVSTDMAQWATGPEHIVEVMTAFVSDGFEEVLYRAFLPMDQENSIFMRLRVFRIEFDTAEDVRY